MTTSGKEQEYIELKDRINQDVIHDNFVPKYSALASAEPSVLILIGVWLIFAPQILLYAVFWAVAFFASEETSPLTTHTPITIQTVLVTGYCVLIATILWQQTRRFLLHRRVQDE